MARGWESKAVELQMESANAEHTDGPDSRLSDEQKKAKREQEGLILARANVLRQLEATTNERYAESLRQALSDLESRIK